ncbi:uncharacterized protein LOC6577782 [Drosophila mojavensis]|uniref:G-protein coupled receptors family 1 profile domain-containing protein n=1 Tax=Drosophila mojavensis TaxID=7230 RepID=B4KG22_DROMO|nr:uncharacterized protein LOC6577782 [Drosophila mojavensis]EDW13161.1 uncharacterized protein Dmoj_GI21404 [Drosophila mojavensis]
METWISSTFILMILLVHVRTGSVRHGLIELDFHNNTDTVMDMYLRPAESILSESYCRLLLFKLQDSECPFMRLILHILMALPIYNLMLIVICWQLNRSASHSAERIVVVLQPIVPSSRLDPPAVLTPLVSSVPSSPPLPPPRCRRRQAPKPPARTLRHQQSFASGYPNQRDPFAAAQGSCNPDQYKILRRNLKRVLEGLQQPVPTPTTPSLPLPLCLAKEDSTQSSSTVLSLETPKKKTKSRKLFGTLFKRLSKVFVRKLNRAHDVEINSSTKCVDRGTNGSGIFHPIWKRIKTRARRRPEAQPMPSSSSESISTNGSSQCIYSS